MRILHISETYAEVGGAETYLLGVMQGLEALGHQNSIIYQRRHPRTLHVEGRGEYYVPLGDAVPPPSPVRRLLAGSSDEWYLYGQPALRQAQEATSRIIERENPDAIYLHLVYHPTIVEAAVNQRPTMAYIHGLYPCCPSNSKLWFRNDAVCTIRLGLRCILHIYRDRCSSARHPLSVCRKLILAERRKRAYQNVDRLLVPSRYVCDVLVQNGFLKSRIAVLPYFVDGLQGESSTENPPTSSVGDNTVLYAGRLSREKGFPYLLKAFARVQAPARLAVAGDGRSMPLYRQLADDLGVGDRTDFYGWLNTPELEDLCRRASLLVMPSVCPETFGQAGPEAMLRGKPVVAFAVGGIPDWLHHEQNGLLVQPRDVGGLARAIERLLRDTMLARRLGENGRQFVLEHYNRKKHMIDLEEILGEVVR